MDINESLQTQVKELRAVVLKQQEQLKQLSSLPNSVGAVVGVYKHSVMVDDGGPLLEVEPPVGFKVKLGSMVRLHQQTRQIVALSDMKAGGVLAIVSRVLDDTMEVEAADGRLQVDRNGIKADIGDQVLLNRSKQMVLKAIPSTPPFQASVQEISWDQVGGNAFAKEQMIEAIEWPDRHATLYRQFNKPRLKGLLLYGPPGNGKTLLARAASHAMAELHGEAGRAGFFSIRGPEVLSKWVGEGEAAVRQLFHTARNHAQRHGFPAVIFADEVDSLLARRGLGYHGHTDTIVNQFLAEMDGMEPSGALVILATNRADMLDPAVLRDGRIDRKIEVPPPTADDALEIVGIHLRGVPLDGLSADGAAQMIVEQVYAKNQAAASGALLAGIVDRATTHAIRRHVVEKERVSGVAARDIGNAVRDSCTH